MGFVNLTCPMLRVSKAHLSETMGFYEFFLSITKDFENPCCPIYRVHFKKILISTITLKLQVLINVSKQ